MLPQWQDVIGAGQSHMAARRISFTARLIWCHSRESGSPGAEIARPLLQPNKSADPMIGREQRCAMTEVGWLITQQEVATQMHADKKGFTQFGAEPTFAYVQPGGRASVPSACIPSYRRESAFPLSWPTGRSRWRGIGEALPTRRAAPHDAVVRGTQRLVGTVSVPRRISVAALFSQCDLAETIKQVRGLSDRDRKFVADCGDSQGWR